MNARNYYEQQLNTLHQQSAQTKNRLRLLSTLRLIVFLSVSASIYFFFGNYPIIGISVFVGITLFLILVNLYANTKTKLRFLRLLTELNEKELRILNYDLSGCDPGKAYVYEDHDFNQDIDLFGEGSLFQKLNRTALKNGEQHLADMLNSNLINNVGEKQEAIKELASMTDWRQNYTVTAAMIESDISSEIVQKWVKNHKRFTPKIFSWLPIIFSVISIGLVTTYFLEFVNGITVGAWFMIGLGITAKYLKQITEMYNVTSKIDDLLRQYARLLQIIESTEFESTSLRQEQSKIRTGEKPASQVVAELSNEVGNLGNRNNFLFAFFGNSLLLWDLRFTYRIENWIESFDGALETWFKTVEHFDALTSMATFAFNHENYVYPKITENPSLQFHAENLGHPLLHHEKAVKNPIKLDQHDFFIITGANMAGKSTFLRTVAMNLVMANCGLPVCADSFEYKPVKLISSMRTSDSLVNDESYFFSELKRLKFIVERIEKETYFIILDEILKGTNSVDKAQGSQKFVERLVKSGSTGLIATHDLSLCSLADSYKQIENHYFDAEIVNDELYFDYRFKDGICQNMNASFLLKKMNIV